MQYLRGNLALISSYMQRWGIEWISPEASFLCWFNCEELMRTHPVAQDISINTPRSLFESFGVGLSDGSEFSVPNWARLNFGTSRENLQVILERMDKVWTT